MFDYSGVSTQQCRGGLHKLFEGHYYIQNYSFGAFESVDCAYIYIYIYISFIYFLYIYIFYLFPVNEYMLFDETLCCNDI